MKQGSQDSKKYSHENKKRNPIVRIIYSFKYSTQGIKYIYKNEASVWLHFLLIVASTALGIFYQITLVEWAIIIFAVASILACELLNTGIEAAVDLVTLEKRELARIAKDCGSAASAVFSVACIIAEALIFIPYIIK